MISVQLEDFDPLMEYQGLLDATNSVGAVVTFVGLVRDMNESQRVQGLELEHYEGMTESVLEQLVSESKRRWRLSRVRIIHRVGKLAPGDQIVFVGVSSAHRDAAFAACEYLIDALKTQAPFWKKESQASGVKWLEERSSDQLRMAKWRQDASSGST